MPDFPLKGSQHTELGDHRRMNTDITISSSGRIDGLTDIWTSKKWIGFHGSVVVFITDSDGNILYATKPQKWGVSGTATGRDHKRLDLRWEDSIPSEVIDKIEGYMIHHTYTPITTVNPEEFQRWAEAIAPLIKAFNSQERLLRRTMESEELEEVLV
ncbi:hypothetical protein [Paenibacillus polymyxa]|uniref:hypothetical protein n=1 Tax=Paenibacillus polymyxa TaxID=1406 RepID=UPI000845E058|nr:hypothetical protein [Paenibacillus polymyxa]AOK89571.1 hypothetical protein AOU00_06950 [Paenibacillus polymyxa]